MNPWKETVRDLYDLMYFDDAPKWDIAVAKFAVRIIEKIEAAHPDYFWGGHTVEEWEKIKTSRYFWLRAEADAE